MSTRVGHIFRHEDVHGVSGTGRVADVFEASNGKAIVVWTSANPSVVVYDNAKALENTHGHGGKTDVVWIFEEEREPDPMEKIFEKKIIEAGGTVGKSGESSPAPNDEDAQEAEAEALAEELAADAGDIVAKVADKVAKKVSKKLTEKVAKRVAEQAENGKDEDASEQE